MKQKFKDFIKKFFLINDTPHKVAGGAALGIFLGIIPGEGVLAALLLSSLFRLNRLAATAGVLAVNMWSTAVILPVAAFVGANIFGENYNNLIQTFQDVRAMGWKTFLSDVVVLQLALPLAVGYLLVAALVSLGFYFLIYHLLRKNKITLVKKK